MGFDLIVATAERAINGIVNSSVNLHENHVKYEGMLKTRIAILEQALKTLLEERFHKTPVEISEFFKHLKDAEISELTNAEKEREKTNEIPKETSSD